MTTAPKYKRILLKLSGEAFKGSSAYGFDQTVIRNIALQIKHINSLGVQVCIVVGGGNIWRGAEAEKNGMDRVTADYAGMLATCLLYTSPSPRVRTRSRMPSSA